MSKTRESRRILVTGAGRGLGLEFTRRWLESGHRVFALLRSPEGSDGLRDLARTHAGNLTLVKGDVADDASIAGARGEVEKHTDRLDLLLNNAGIYGPREDSLASVKPDDLHRVFEVNVVGPIRVTREFLPLLRRGDRPRIVHMTSLMGSVKDNSSGGSWAYRLSKAALNMANRNLALEPSARDIVSVALHPGWVRTDMGGASAPLTLEESVGAMIATIDRLEPRHSGTFLDRQGEPLPW